MSQAGIFTEQGFTSLDKFADRVLRAVTVLAGAGVKSGSTVALLLRNGTAFLEATKAVQALGAYVVPINWHLAPLEIAYLLDDSGASVLIGENDLLEPLELRLRIFSADDGGRWPHWEAALAGAAPSRALPEPPTDVMFYTSGTTGKPKGVRRVRPSVEQAAQLSALRNHIYGSVPGMRLLISAPLYHSAPNPFALSALNHQGTLVLQRKFDAERTLQLIEEHGITHAFMVPTMFVRLLNLAEEIRGKYDLSSLCRVLHVGAQCPVHVKSQMIDWWGPVLAEYYGSTEMGPITFCDSEQWLAHPGTVGQALHGVKPVIRDENGNDCEAGTIGEICVDETPQPDFTYHGNEDKRRAMALGNGVATGDIGFLNEDGFLFICDRKIDMIISGGVNIYPAEIEGALAEIEGVVDCAVLGKPDPEYGESVVALIKPDPASNLTAEDIKAALRQKIAGFKVPREIFFSDNLPRDEGGKMVKRKLRELLQISG